MTSRRRAVRRRCCSSSPPRRARDPRRPRRVRRRASVRETGCRPLLPRRVPLPARRPDEVAGPARERPRRGPSSSAEAYDAERQGTTTLSSSGCRDFRVGLVLIVLVTSSTEPDFGSRVVSSLEVSAAQLWQSGSWRGFASISGRGGPRGSGFHGRAPLAHGFRESLASRRRLRARLVQLSWCLERCSGVARCGPALGCPRTGARNVRWRPFWDRLLPARYSRRLRGDSSSPRSSARGFADRRVRRRVPHVGAMGARARDEMGAWADARRPAVADDRFWETVFAPWSPSPPDPDGLCSSVAAVPRAAVAGGGRCQDALQVAAKRNYDVFAKYLADGSSARPRNLESDADGRGRRRDHGKGTRVRQLVEWITSSSGGSGGRPPLAVLQVARNRLRGPS